MVYLCLVDGKQGDKKLTTPSPQLVPVPDATNTPRDAFIELWDVGGGRRSAPLRRLFYSDVAGVIVCHDLSASSSSDGAASKAIVRSWTQEVAACASFRGAVGGAGGGSTRLPVPLLVVGTKADAAPRGGRSSPRRGALASLAAMVARVSTVRQAGGAAAAARAAATSPPPARAGVATATTSAVDGDLDAATFADFFKAVLALRMTGSPPTGGGAGGGYAGWSPSPGGRVGVADVGGGLGDDDDLV